MSRRMLLKEAATELGVTKHFLYTEARAGRVPCFRAGGTRYIFDVEQVDEFLKQKAMENIRKEEEEAAVGYGKIRKIN